MDKRGINKRVMSACGRALNRWRSLQKKKALQKVLWIAGDFLIAAILAKADILGGHSPFAVAYVAASCAKGSGFAAVLGCFFGYLFLGDALSSLQYAAAALLCVTVAHVFADTRAFSRALFMPLTAGISMALTGFVFVLSGSMGMRDIALFVCEVVLCTGLAYFYMQAANKRKGRSAEQVHIARMVLLASLLIALSGVTVFGLLSPARILAVMVVMASAYQGDLYRGAALGVALGMTLDAAANQSPFFACAYGFSALVAGVFRKTSKTLFLAAYVVANATATLLGLTDPRYLAGLYESFVASVLFAMMPDALWLPFGLGAAKEEGADGEDGRKLRDLVRARATEVSHAFYEMYLGLASTFDRGKPGTEEDISAVFDRAADQVCRKCSLQAVCWEKEYLSTKSVLNDVTNPMLRRGHAISADFPAHFSARCVRFADFLFSINEGVAALLSRWQLSRRLMSNRALVAQQYIGITSVLRELGSGLEDIPESLPLQGKKLRQYAKAFGAVKGADVTRDRMGRITIEIRGSGIADMMRESEGFTAGLAALMGVDLTAPEQLVDGGGAKLILRQKPTHRAKIGMGIRKKEGAAASGDSGTYFETADGKAFLLLSDGMGTGPAAAVESKTALAMLERFLRAGIDGEEAMKIIAPALRIRSGGESFVTLDLACVDLFTGYGKLMKLGASPSYIKSKDGVRTISGQALPAGLDCEGDIRPDVVEFSLRRGDALILASDGLSDGGGDAWLREAIGEWDGGGDVKQFSANLILRALDEGSLDDMTCLTLALCG